MAFFVRSLRPGETKVGVRDLATGATDEWPETADGVICALASSPSGHLVAWSECNSAAGQFRIRVADTASMSPRSDVGGRLFFRDQHINVLRFSRDERPLALGSWSGELSLGVMDVEKGALLWYTKEFGPWDAAFSPDGRWLFASNAAGCLACYDSRTGKEVRSDVVKFPYPVGFFTTVQANERLLAVDVSPDGRLVAASTDYTHKVIIWDAVSGKRLKSMDLSDYPIEQALFFDPSGKGIWAAGSLDTKLRCFPLELTP